jgi:cytochrome c6
MLWAHFHPDAARFAQRNVYRFCLNRTVCRVKCKAGKAYLMKRKLLLAMGAMVGSATITWGADASALWSSNCASCHGKDGSGNTAMGKKLAVKDYTKDQGFSDAEAEKAIKDGKGKMKGYKAKLSDDDVKALVAYVRKLKK